MTTPDNAQPEALRLAARLECFRSFPDDVAAAAELRRLHAESTEQADRIASLDAQLIHQTNRAAAAEQQVTAMTQRWKMANALNTEARNQLAQLSQAQAVPTDSLLSLESSAHEIFNNPPSDTSQDVRDVIEWYAASVRVALAFPTTPPASMLAASPTPPARKGLSIKQINELEAEAGLDHYELVRLVERAHGIQGEGNE